MFKHWIIVALIGALTLSLVTIVTAQDSQTANFEIRVWQSTSDAERLFISARPEASRWGDTVELDMSGLNSRETFRYGDIILVVPSPQGDLTDLEEACRAAVAIITEKAVESEHVAYLFPPPDCVAIPANFAAGSSHDGLNDYFAVGTFLYADAERQLKTATWDMCVFPEEEGIEYEYGTRFVPDWESELESYRLSIDYDGRERLYEHTPWNRQRELSFVYAEAAYCRR